MKSVANLNRVLLADIILPSKETLTSTLLTLPLPITKDFGYKLQKELIFNQNRPPLGGLKRVSFHDSLISKIEYYAEKS